MHFTFNGQEYWIEFQFTTKRKGRHQRQKTTARIVTGERGKDKTLVIQGTVTRYAFDTYSKETGRTEALNKICLAILEVGVDPNFVSLARKTYHRRPGGLDYRPVQQQIAATAAV